MRLNRLGLPAYGHFTQTSLPLPHVEPGQPDLHVIFGPNEAGKSTLFAAWLDLLFGFQHKTSFDFLHERRALRIEADLQDTQGRSLRFARIKGMKNTLLDSASDQPVSDAALGALLGGLDRDSYSTMFSLDEATLVQGGEAILAHQGDLGELLFQATAGLADLSEHLRGLRAEGDAWFKPRARKTALAALKDQLVTLNAARKKADLGLAEWRALQEDAQAADAAYARLSGMRAQTAAERDAADRDVQALSVLARLLREQARLAELPEPQDLPQDWGNGIDDWLQEDTSLKALTPQADAALNDATTALEALQQDPAALRHAEGLDALQERYGAHLKSLEDLPRRSAERDTLEVQLQQVLANLGLQAATVEDIRLPAPVMAQISAILDKEAAIRGQMSTAQDELAKAQGVLAGLIGNTDQDAAPDRKALAQLVALLAEIRRQDPFRVWTDAQASLEAAKAAQRRALADLSPWQGTQTDLLAIDLPGADSLRALQGEITRADASLTSAEADLQRQALSVQRLQARLGVTQPFDANMLKAARAERDRLWQAHLQTLSRQTADAFAQAMTAHDDAQADAIVAARMAERLDTLRAEQAALANAQEQADKARATLQGLQDRVRRLWSMLLGADSGADVDHRSLEDLLQWQDARDSAVQACHAADGAAANLQLRREQLLQAQADLQAALRAAGAEVTEPSAGFLALQAQAETLREDAARLLERGERLHAAKADVANRKLALEQLRCAHAENEAGLRQVLADTWIAPQTDPVQVQALLQGLRALEPLQRDLRNLQHRIERIDADARSFQGILRALADDLNVDWPADDGATADARAIWPQLRARMRAALQTEEDCQRLLDAKARAQDTRRELSQRADALARAIAPLHAHFGAIPLHQIATALATNIRARDIQVRMRDTRDEFIGLLRGADIASETERLRALDLQAAEARRDTLTATLQTQDQALREAYARVVAAHQALDGAGQDAGAARVAEEYQTVLLQIAEEARHHLAQQAGILAVDSALRRYRETHRSSMMTRAGKAFNILTCGRYSGLATRPDGTRDLLIAQEQDGAAKPADTLSKGTAFQLFLALRIAGYLELADQRPMVPFIADDIMESFDDDRAEAAFGLLAEMARKGQVIYLTHHAHLCDIARRACPTVQVHDLRQMQSV